MPAKVPTAPKPGTAKIPAPKPVAEAPVAKAPKIETPVAATPAPALKPIAPKSPAPGREVSTVREITSELIAARAYFLWKEQGCPQGNDQANWLLAESQLKQETRSFGS
jgi:hypothetical protein